MSALLGDLERRQTTTDFETRLSARLADVKRPSSWLGRLRASFMRPATLAPAMALCSLVAVLAFSPRVSNPALNQSRPAHEADSANLVSFCVAQHRSELDKQPLSDWSANNLAGQSDADPGTASDEGTL